MTRHWLVVLALLTACGDDSGSDTPKDATEIDAFRNPNACTSSMECTDGASDTCCISVSPSGAVKEPACGTHTSHFCDEVACDPANGTKCTTLQGVVGSCQGPTTLGNSDRAWYVCR